MFSDSILKFYRGVWVYAASISAILELVSTFQVSIMLWASPVSKPDVQCLENPDGTVGSCIGSGTEIVKALVGIAFFGIILLHCKSLIQRDSRHLHGSLRGKLDKNVLHWSKVSVDVPTDKALWMTMDDNNEDVARFVHNLLSPPKNNAYTSIGLVDLSQTRSTLWPLIRGLLSVSPQYKEEIGNSPPTPFSEYFKRFPRRPSSFGIDEKWDMSPLNHDDKVDVRFCLSASLPANNASLKDDDFQADPRGCQE
ncbi:hypothetical protein MVEN_02513700 [Mycena venus]|uniref:Uncharacterized protein n=1 Tax=Mycena venus TaxID=2733690 RepID=A0A8H6U0E1_9AGAR|nr:hypothetical protein MVEN_02513700 [Mycena venus]